MQTESLIRKDYNELVLASFGSFQIAVLSAKTNVGMQFCSAKIGVARREYESRGWLFHQNYHLGWLQAIAVEPLENSGPFKIAPAFGGGHSAFF